MRIARCRFGQAPESRAVGLRGISAEWRIIENTDRDWHDRFVVTQGKAWNVPPESYLCRPVPGGKRGRGAEGKVIIAIAVERKGLGKKSKRWKLGRTRIQVVPDTKAKTLLDFVEDTCEQGSTIYTDGLSAYKNLPSRGFKHDATAVSQGSDPTHVVLPAVHRSPRS